MADEHTENSGEQTEVGEPEAPETTEAPEYLADNLAAVHKLGVLKDVARAETS